MIRSFLLFIFFVLTSLSGWAAKEQFSDRLEGSDINTSNGLEVIDDKYPIMDSDPNWSNDFYNKKVTNTIRLGVLPETKLTTDEDCEVIMDVDYRLANGTVQSFTCTLYVEYLSDGTFNMNDKSTYVFDDAHVVQIDITSVSSGSIDDFFLETTMKVERYYTFDGGVVSNIGVHTITDDYIEFYWGSKYGAESYELEYIHINNYTISGGTIPQSALYYDFYNSATRITIDKLSYRIPNTFDKGYIVFRVRAIGRAGTQFDKRYEGSWNVNESGLISSISSSNKLIISSEYDATLNWSYQAAMSEDGKRMQGISYSDGLGRPRQQLMHNPETGQVVVSNTYYDYHGRPVIQDMGTPVDDEELKHYPQFNRSAVDGLSFGPEHFDDDGGSCPSLPDPFHTSYGAGKYYSSNNSDIDGANHNIPDAEGYPYSQVQYMPDQTGRIKRSGAFGDEHQIGNGHETKYAYSTPTQEEINRLFGSEAGYAHQYQKRLMEDANGQYYVTYYDLAGRVVASGLAGSAPNNVSAIDGESPLGDFEFNLLDPPSVTETETMPNEISTNEAITITDNGDYAFSYDFTPEDYSDSCLTGSVCFDCVYDITLLIKEAECDFSTVFEHTIQLTGNDFDNICQDTIIDIDTLINLPEGDYIVSRNLSINQSAIDEYWCSYLENNDCVPSYTDIYNDLYGDLTFFDCADVNFEPDDFDVAGDSRCDMQKQVMLMQMSPGGQYALYSLDANGDVDASSYPLSIFNSSNSLPDANATWDNPVSTYLDDNGNDAYIITELVGTNANDGTHYEPQLSSTASLTQINNTDFYQAPPEDLLHPSDFIVRFEPSWAASLLDYHPEVCYLDFCYLNEPSENYNNGMDTIYTFSEACSEGYFNPLDTTYLYLDQYIYNDSLFDDCFNTSAVDSFFIPSGVGSYYHDAMLDSMINYVQVGGAPTTIDMWTYAVYLVEYDGQDFDYYQDMIRMETSDTCNRDAIWVMFRSLYKQLKYYYVKKQELEYAMTNGCYNGCIGEIGFDDNDTIVDNQTFYQYVDQNSNIIYPSSDPNQTCYYENLYEGKTQVFIDYWGLYGLAQDTTAMQDSIDLLNLVQCENTCENNADEWIAGLHDCPNVSQATLDSIRTELISLCQMGCSLDGYPEGISTLPSGSTTYNGNTTFEEVLEEHLGTGYESDVCNFYLLNDVPPQFGQADTSGYKVYLDDCGCDKIMQAHHDFEDLSNQGNLPDGVENIEQMLAYNTGVSLEDANQLLCECDEYYNGDLSTWTPNTWNETNAANLLAAEIIVQPGLSCSEDTTECLDCAYVDSVYNAFISEMESQGIYDVDTSANYEQLVANYMNSALQFNLLGEDYLDFMARCDATDSNPYCTINPDAFGWIKTMDLLAKRGQLSATSASPVDLLNDNIVYENSSFGENLGASYFWSCEGGDCDNETLTVYFGENTSNSCSFTLNFPTGSAISNDQIIGFSNLQPVDDACADTNLFELLAEYIDCGEPQFVTVIGSSDCINIANCACSDFDELLCDDPVPDPIDEPSDCYEQALTEIEVQTEDLYTEYVDTLYEHFEENYNLQCREAYSTEEFVYTGDYQMYQFTLFYYDQAGNLVQTIAPKGISPLDQAQNTAINDARDAVTGPNDTGTTGVFPTHEYVTEYHYNSYGQLSQTTNPDQEGNTNYWYDRYGRIIASQNPHQYDASKYSYTFYDHQGRPVQVGQVETIAVLTEAVAKADDLGANFENWVSNGTRTEVTITQYDEILSSAISNKFENGQQNLRLRVASILYFDNFNSSTNIETDYTTATHYSYDIHGNVLETLQDVPLMKPVEQDIKSTQYEYDLISGNMNKVEYQKDKLDEMTHEYHYDALNRLSEVYTSNDGGIHKANDVRYQYYDYGPLARVEIGEYQVQGMDYAYTINGWIKGANSNTLVKERDMGRDGYSGSTFAYLQNNPNVHQNFAVDSFGFSLNYFEGDYTGIGTNNFEAGYNATNFGNASSSLYNGNIRHMVTAIGDWDIQGYAYTYDQLQRLKEMEVYRDNNLVTNNNWNSSQATTDYLTQISYDKNGNISKLVRNGYAGAQTAMDDMKYYYQTIGGEESNRLDQVRDYASDYGGYEDIKSGQGFGNYRYNRIGELILDNSEDMQMTWRYGDHKLNEVTRTDQSSPNIEFVYNPLGIRVAKIKKPRTSGNELSKDNWVVTYYAYDANGQLMSTYTSNLYDEPTRLTTLKEQYIYGSKRVGVIKRELDVFETDPIEPSLSDIVENEIGHKRFELTNHLGNVMVTVSDRKVWNNTDQVYEPVITMKADYYSFGSLMPGRHEGLGDQRHLFNGMEHDEEVHSSEGNSYTTQFRQYDPRLGRWKSLDPLMAKYPSQSPYAAFNNNPVYFVDPLGLEGKEGDGGGDNGGGDDDGGDNGKKVNEKKGWLSRLFMGKAEKQARDLARKTNGTLNENGAGYSVSYEDSNGDSQVVGITHKKSFVGKVFEKANSITANIWSSISNWFSTSDFVVDFSFNIHGGLGAGAKLKSGVAGVDLNAQAYDVTFFEANYDITEAGSEDAGNFHYIGDGTGGRIKQELSAGVDVVGLDVVYGKLGREWKSGLYGGTEDLKSTNDWGGLVKGEISYGMGSNKSRQKSGMKNPTSKKIQVKAQKSTKEFYGLDIGAGVQVLLGIDFNVKLGVKR